MIKEIFEEKKMFLLITVLLTFMQVDAQTINKPILQFTEVCANSSLNFGLSFGLGATSNFQATNIFTVELSDSTGSFNTPIVLTTSNSAVSPVSVQFAFPSSLIAGLNYKIRIRSSAPTIISPPSDPFPAKFLPHNQSYTINNGFFSQSFCEGSSYVLSIDNGINSPLQYPQLSYIWYKDNLAIAGETGSSLNVTQPGSYYVRTNYGTCPTDSYSNFVSLTTVPAQTLNISSQNNETVLCSAAGIVLTSSSVSTAFVYEWYKNNVAIPNSNNPTYTVTQAGNYFLKIANNACITPSNIISVTQEDFAISVSPSTTIIPGQTTIINCTTNAINPTYSWYKDNVLQVGENLSLLTTNQAGVYKVVVKQNSTCVSEKEITTTISYPTAYTLSVAHLSNYNDCENTVVNLNVNSFFANSTINVLTSGVIINYQWYKNLALIVGATTNTLNLNNYLQNGSYIIKATLENGEVIVSNPLEVKLKFTESVTINTNKNYLCSTNPNALLTTTLLNALYTYTWYNVGNSNSLSNLQTLSVSDSGDYYLKVSFQGCFTTSNIITINKVTDALLHTNYDSNIEINDGEEITIRASGAVSYKWIVAGEPDNLTPNFIVNKPQIILLEATFGDCKLEKTFVVTQSTKPTGIVIPNTITPNNDGTNDSWIIPEEYSYQPEIEIVIFNSRNDILYQSKNYLNNWPNNEIANNTVYYYKILKGSTVLEKGTISIIK
jgi:large repetitive protein